MCEPVDTPAAAASYLRPILDPPDGSGDGRYLLGGGPLSFSAIERLSRGPDGLLREMATSADAAALARLTRPRPALPGLGGPPPFIAGILNVTPDSFSDGGRTLAPDKAVARGMALLADGADLLDIGGESTRPGAGEVPLEVEIARVVPVIRALAAEGATISIDTRKAAVMTAALDAGATIVNDVSALAFDPRALDVVAEAGVPVILMHSRGTPETMARLKRYDDILLGVIDELRIRIEACLAAGIAEARIIIDPGVGFAKGPAQNPTLLKHLVLLHGLGYPVMIGTSRKSFIGHIAGVDDPLDRLPGSLASGLWAVSQGVQYLRVHDVAETRQAVAVWRAIAAAPGGGSQTN